MKLFPKIVVSLVMNSLLLSCGSYETVSSPSVSQSVPVVKGARSLSGKANLRTPAKLGILTSTRFGAHSLKERDVKKLTQPGISSIIPINGYVDDSSCYKMSDLMYRRAQIIENTRFMGLDLILLCDADTSEQEHQASSVFQILSLGMVNPTANSIHTQLNAVLMDARTGYIYGAVGDSGESSALSLTFIEAEASKDFGKSRAQSTAQKQLLDRFPGFWANVKATHHR